MKKTILTFILLAFASVAFAQAPYDLFADTANGYIIITDAAGNQEFLIGSRAIPDPTGVDKVIIRTDYQSYFIKRGGFSVSELRRSTLDTDFGSLGATFADQDAVLDWFKERVKVFKTASGGSGAGDLSQSDINTFSEINAIVADETLAKHGDALSSFTNDIGVGGGTDDQNISGSGLSGNILTIGIEGGNSETVDLSSIAGQDGADGADGVGGLPTPTTETGTAITLPNDGGLILAGNSEDITVSEAAAPVDNSVWYIYQTDAGQVGLDFEVDLGASLDYYRTVSEGSLMTIYYPNSTVGYLRTGGEVYAYSNVVNIAPPLSEANYNVPNADADNNRSVSGGVLTYNSNSTSFQLRDTPENIFTVGNSYRVTVVADSHTGVTFRTISGPGSITLVNGAGTITETFVADDAKFTLLVTSSGTPSTAVISSIIIEDLGVL